MIQIKLKYTRQRIEDPNLHISWGDIVGDVSGNTALQDALDNKQNVGDYATHNDLSTVEDSLQNAINQTKDDINGEINKKQDKGNYALQGDSYTKTESDERYMKVGDVPTDVYTKQETDAKLSNKLDVTAYTPYDDTQVKADIAKKADKTYVDSELVKKQDKGDYALKSEIPSVEGLASETYVSNRIKEVVGTAPEALDTLGEIADKLSGDDDAIAAINQVLDGKVSKEEYNTNQQAINNSLTDLSNNKANKADVYTKTQVDSKLADKLDTTAYTPTDMSNYYTKTESDNKYALKGDVPTDVYTKQETDAKLSNKLDATAYTKYDDTQVKADIQANTTAIEGKQDKGNYALSGSSYTKAESDAKYLTEHQSLTEYAKTAYVNTELAKKQDKGDYALKSEIPSVEGLATESYVSNRIKEVVGTAPEALDTLGEIADKLSGDDDAIAAINQVLDGKVNKDDYSTNQQTINNSLTDLSNNKADKSEIPTIPLFKTINGQAITGSTDNIVIESGSDIELPISSDDVAFFSDDLEVKSELHIGDTFTSRCLGFYSDYGDQNTFEFDGGYEIFCQYGNLDSFKGFESVTANGSIKYNGKYYAILDLGKKYTLTLTSMSNDMSGESNNYAITLGKASKSLTNALNGLSFWKGTQEEYDAITTKDNNTIYYII